MDLDKALKVQIMSIQWIAIDRLPKVTENLSAAEVCSNQKDSTVVEDSTVNENSTEDRRDDEIDDESNAQSPDPVGNLFRSIDKIIQTFNDQEKKKKSENKKKETYYKMDGYCYSKTSYSSVFYSCRNEVTPNISRVTQAKSEKSITSHYLLFYYREQPRRIIALTSGNAWRVVRPYIDYSFAIKVAEKVGDPSKITQIVRRCLCGPNTREDLLHPSVHQLYKTSNLYYLVENFKCDIKNESSLFSLISKIEKENRSQIDATTSKYQNKATTSEFQIEATTNRWWIKATTRGILRIGKKFSIENYLAIFDLLAEYVEGKEPTKNVYGKEEISDPLFEFLHFLKPAYSSKKKLDEQLAAKIFSEKDEKEPLGDIRHRKLEDFLFSNSFEIKIGSSEYRNIGSKPPEMKKIIQIIGAQDLDAFQKALQKGKLKFIDQASQEQEESIIDCIEAQIEFEGNTHFKISKMWYILEADHLALLCADFKELLEHHLMANTDKWQLLEPWKGTKGGEKEASYCHSYLDNEGYLVFDQILVNNIETCDILKYNENAVYLYQVKEKLDQNSRIACSQILNAAVMIRGALALKYTPSNFLYTLWKEATKGKDGWRKKLKDRLVKLKRENFIDIFRKRKIIFVYAYLPSPKSKCLSAKLELSKDTKDENVERKLMDDGSLDSQGRVTTKFISKKDRKLEIDGETEDVNKRYYDQLDAGRFSNSTIAKFELLRLAQNLRELNFDFKICEIPRE